MEIKDLIGKTINKLYISENKEVLRAEMKAGNVIHITAVGDCCSHSWFEHLSGVEAILGEQINEVLEREMPDETVLGYEHIQYYGYTFVTDKGRFDIEFRNSSNGYYGGRLIVSSKPRNQYNNAFDSDEVEEMGQFKKVEEDI